MFGDGPDSCIIFKSSRLSRANVSRAVILINEYVNTCKYISAILQIYLHNIVSVARFYWRR